MQLEGVTSQDYEHEFSRFSCWTETHKRKLGRLHILCFSHSSGALALLQIRKVRARKAAVIEDLSKPRPPPPTTVEHKTGSRPGVQGDQAQRIAGDKAKRIANGAKNAGGMI